MSDPTRGGRLGRRPGYRTEEEERKHGPKPSRSNAGWRTGKEWEDDRREEAARADSILSGTPRKKKPGIGGAIAGVLKSNSVPATRTPAQRQEAKDNYMHYPRTASGGFGEPRRIGPRTKPVDTVTDAEVDETERKQRAKMPRITDDEIAARKMGRR